MSVILNSLLKKEITVEDLIKWLSYKDIKDEAHDILKNLDNKRVEFLPYFLNYLRDQTSNIVQNSQSSGLTPKKPQSNDIKKSNNNVEYSYKNIRSTSRIKLFPSEQENTDSNSKIVSGTKNRRYPQLITNDAHVKNHNARIDFRSTSKLCLGQFINLDIIGNTPKRKTIQPISIQKENAKYCENIFNSGSFEEINLNDFESFPPFEGIPRKKKETLKRIVPTSLNTQPTVLEQTSSQNFIKKERTAIKKNVTNYNKNFKQSSNSSKSSIEGDISRDAAVNSFPALNIQSISIGEIAQASMKDVTFQDELDIIGNLYSSLIDENLIPNISVELYFLIQLLTVRNEPAYPLSCDEKHYFQTVHNCVYFSVRVLTLQKKTLKILDNITLKLLANNSRVEKFSSDLKTYLSKVCETPEIKKNFSFTSPIGSVSFQSDKDNRNNFPDDQTFHVFRKQRDLFYEILREWDANHLNPGWSMRMNQGEKIRSVVNAWPNPSVYSHLARLFLNQLIATCKGYITQDKNSDSVEDLELSDLKCKNPEKFKRLQKRFVAPFYNGGPSPTPSFTGPQEFFSEFITIANCPAFNQYVMDNLVFQIMQLNKVELNISENYSTHIEDAVKHKFVSTLTSLRLLAKFLGFLVFSPYKCSERIPQELKADSIAMRNKIPLVLNLKSMLTDAVTHRRLILTIPWMVEFLSMMDAIASLLDNIQEILLIFLYFYRIIFLELKQKEFNLNYLFLLLLLGWLFEIHNVSSGLFFTELNESSFDHEVKNYYISDICFCLDSVQLVDHHILYACCPYLGELKIVLGDFAAGMNNRSSSIKKIIPTPADHHGKSSMAEKHLQFQLEENFFHNHPQSLRKTVEFISERMASNVIKHVKKEIIPTSRNESFGKLYKYFLEVLKNKGKTKANFALAIQEISSEMSHYVKLETFTFLNSYFKERVASSLKLLLSEDISANVVDLCSLIATRWSKEKVNHWIAMYVTPGLFNEELQVEIEKYKKINVIKKGKMPEACNPLPNGKALSFSSYASFSPTDILIQIKAQLKMMYTDRLACNSKEINQTMQDFELLMQPVMDVSLSVKRLLLQLSLEFMIALIVIQPSTLSKIDFIKFLQNCKKNSETLSTVTSEIICPRNLILLASSSKSQESWAKFEVLLSWMLKEKLLETELFERQCLSALKQEWPEEFLQMFVRCIDGVIKEYERTIQVSQDFRDLKEWLHKKHDSYQEYDLPRI